MSIPGVGGTPPPSHSTSAGPRFLSGGGTPASLSWQEATSQSKSGPRSGQAVIPEGNPPSSSGPRSEWRGIQGSHPCPCQAPGQSRGYPGVFPYQDCMWVTSPPSRWDDTSRLPLYLHNSGSYASCIHIGVLSCHLLTIVSKFEVFINFLTKYFGRY